MPLSSLRLLTFLVIFSISSHASDTRTESLGDLEGILGVEYARLHSGEVVVNPMLMSSSQLYEVYARGPATSGGFESDMPLKVSLSTLSNRVCYSLFLDQSHTFDEMSTFAQTYLGAEVRLRDVQVVFVRNKRSHCSFKEFEVLANRDEVARLVEERRIAEQLSAGNQADDVNFDSDRMVLVFNVSLGFVRFRVIPEDGESIEAANHTCNGRATIEPRLTRDQVYMVRSELDKASGRARLANVTVKDGSCTVERVVPAS